MRRAAAAWGAWCLVVFGLYNLGLEHARFRALELAADRGELRASPRVLLDVARAYLTNDGDVRRYLAYCDATLGRPYQGYYVRSTAAWRTAFAASENLPADGAAPVPPTGRLLPYRDFLVEYPPGFFLVALPPAWLTSDGYAYLLAFGTLMALLLTAALLLCARIAPLVGGAVSPARLAAWGAACAFAVGVIATHRYDAAVALLVCAVAWAALARRPLLLGLAAGAAIAVKIVPVVVLPLWLIHLGRARRWREIALACLVAALATAALCLPAARAAGASLLDIVRYHGDRPLQIESTAAALLALVARPSVEVTRTFGSTNLTGPLAHAGLVAANLASAAGLALVYFAGWRGAAPGRDEAARNRSTVAATAAALAVFIACGKVFSPQYLVWLLPLGLLLSLVDGRRALLALFLAVLALTQVIYPLCYGALEALRPWACALVLARNLGLLAWAALLLARARRSPLVDRINHLVNRRMGGRTATATPLRAA